jgi:hypothetical protein
MVAPSGRPQQCEKRSSPRQGATGRGSFRTWASTNLSSALTIQPESRSRPTRGTEKSATTPLRWCPGIRSGRRERITSTAVTEEC